MSIEPNDPTKYDAPQVFPATPNHSPAEVPFAYAPVPTPYAQAPGVDMETPVKVLGICYLILAALGFILALFAGSFLHAAMLNVRAQNPDTPLLPASFGTLVSVLIGLIAGLLPIITGIGLLTRASWGRVMAIVNGILILISIPVGTILGGLTLFFMLRTGAREGYARLTQRPAAY